MPHARPSLECSKWCESFCSTDFDALGGRDIGKDVHLHLNNSYLMGFKYSFLSGTSINIVNLERTSWPKWGGNSSLLSSEYSTGKSRSSRSPRRTISIIDVAYVCTP